MATRTRVTSVAASLLAQSAHGTAETTSLFRIPSTSTEVPALTSVTESDAADIGKTDEFATDVFLLGWKSDGRFASYASSEMFAWAFAFALGNSVAANPTGSVYTHTATPQSSTSVLPKFTTLVKLPADGSVRNYTLKDCVINSLSLNMTSALQRSNLALDIQFVGSGDHILSPATAMPAVGTFHRVGAGGASITILGTDYTVTKTVRTLTFEYNNNVDVDNGYNPGGGQTNGGAIMGEMNHGDRTVSLRVRVYARPTDPEFTQLTSRTTGTAVLTFNGDLITGAHYHGLVLTLHKVQVSGYSSTDENGYAAVDLTYEVMRHSTNGLLTAVSKNTTPLVGTET